jgi:hypothetical protein
MSSLVVGEDYAVRERPGVIVCGTIAQLNHPRTVPGRRQCSNGVCKTADPTVQFDRVLISYLDTFRGKTVNSVVRHQDIICTWVEYDAESSLREYNALFAQRMRLQRCISTHEVLIIDAKLELIEVEKALRARGDIE